LPANNSAASTITIARGTYFEIIHVTSKNNVILHGEDRKGTVILGVNNNNLNPSTAARSLVGIDRSSGFVIENLTIHNLTPQGGSQAEALRMQACDKCIVRQADIISLQDTLLWSGRIYASDSYIEGNVDFVWGTGAALFDRCEIKTVGRAGVIVQARNGAAGFGYVFVDSKLTADPGLTGNMLGRIDVSAYPDSHVAYINCQMGNHIAPAGWTISGGSAGASLRFWEYQSTDASGALLDVSRRVAGSKQISEADAMKMRDPTQVLGGWAPPK
jgi:pectin methylesterase-like acyl-CoA thioesterase